LTSAPRTFRDLVARIRSRLEEITPGRYQINRADAPNAGELRQIEQRQALVTSWLTPSAMKRVEARVAVVFLWFPTVGLSADSAEATTTAYARAVCDLPLWAIEKACMKIRDSGATFRPSAPELRKLAKAECDPAYQELADLRQITTAEQYVPSANPERQRVQAMFKKLAADLEGGQVASGLTPLGDVIRRAMD